MQYVAFPLGMVVLLWWFTPLGFVSSFVLGSILGVMLCVAPETLVGIVICTIGYILYIMIGLMLRVV
jgi:hypothetical protein